MKAWRGTLLWVIAGIAPLAIALVVLVRWDQIQRHQAARTEAERDAQALARIVALTAGIGQRQLEMLADAPALEEAILSGDREAVAEELARFHQSPAWRGLVVVAPDGETIASAGQILGSDLEAAPDRDGVAVASRIGFQPARALMSAPVVIGGKERARLLGAYSLREVETELASPSDGGLSMILRPDGTLLLGGPGVVATDGPIRFTRKGARTVAHVAGKEMEAAIVPVLGGNAQVASLQEPEAFARGVGGTVATLLVAMGVLASVIVSSRQRVARSEERMRFRERELAALQELAIDATVAPGREQILQMAGARAAQLQEGIDATYVAIAHGDEVLLHPTFPEPGEAVALPVAGNLLLARALQHGRRETGRTGDTPEDWRAAGFAKGGWESWTPIVAHGRILGALGCRSRSDRGPLLPWEARLLESLSATLAVALESHERLADLARERAVLSTVLDSSPDGIIALDEADRVLLENRAARELLHLRRPAHGRPLDDLIDEAKAAGGRFVFDFEPHDLLRQSRQGITTRGSFRLSYDGEARVMESLMAPVRLPGGGLGSLVAMRDVTARAELEEVRRLHEQVSRLAREAEGRAALLERILAASDLGLVFLDREGRVAWANQRFGQLLGMTPPRRGEREDRLVESIRSRVEEPSLDLRQPAVLHTRDPAPKILALGSTEVRDPAGREVGQLVSLRDETARRELEQARESFIGVAAHELKNPLAVLRLQAEMGLRDAERAPASLARILERTRQLQALVERLLDVTRADLNKLELERTDVDPMACVREAVEPFLAGDATIRVQGGAPHLHGDAVRIKQVITNLLSNAIRHGGGGLVDVRVSAEGGVIRIAVRDRGPGIPAEDQKKIFERFAQGGARRGQGLGIGLYLARRIAEAHGGTIELESAPGEGSTFTLVLPTGTGYSAATQAATQP